MQQIEIYHIWQKVEATDPNFPSVKAVYKELFTTTDRAHAQQVTANSDARYVYTTTMAFFGYES